MAGIECDVGTNLSFNIPISFSRLFFHRSFGSSSLTYLSLFTHHLLSLSLCLILLSQGALPPWCLALLLQGLRPHAPPFNNLCIYQLTIGRARTAGIVQIMIRQMTPTSSGNQNTSFFSQGYVFRSYAQPLTISILFRLSMLFLPMYSPPLLALFPPQTCSIKLLVMLLRPKVQVIGLTHFVLPAPNSSSYVVSVLRKSRPSKSYITLSKRRIWTKISNSFVRCLNAPLI